MNKSINEKFSILQAPLTAAELGLDIFLQLAATKLGPDNFHQGLQQNFVWTTFTMDCNKNWPGQLSAAGCQTYLTN